MEKGTLGKVYLDGDIIIRQGEIGDCMYVIQDGYVEVVKDFDGLNSQVVVLGKGDFFGEMEIFEHESRMATVRALGTARILTLDKGKFLRRIHEDPSSAYRMLQVMSRRIRESHEENARFKSSVLGQGLPSKVSRDKDLGARFKSMMTSLPRQMAWLSKVTVSFQSSSDKNRDKIMGGLE